MCGRPRAELGVGGAAPTIRDMPEAGLLLPHSASWTGAELFALHLASEKSVPVPAASSQLPFSSLPGPGRREQHVEPVLAWIDLLAGEGRNEQNRDLHMKEMPKGSRHTEVEITFSLFSKER